jgi:PAS domain S-box-containing protein
MLTDPLTVRAASSSNPLQQVYKEPDTDTTIHAFSRPIYSGGNKVGSVRLGFSPDIHPLFSDSDIRSLLLVATLVFSLVPTFYYLMRRSMSSLVSLDSQLKYVLEKKEFSKIKVPSKSGAGKLVDKFNRVISYFKDKYESLRISYEDIEVANKVLSYEKEKVESIIDNISDGIIVTDAVGSVKLVNRSMAHLVNLSRDDVIGHTIQDCFDNQDILSFIERNQGNGSASSQKNMEITLKQFDRETIVRISYLPLLSQEESFLGTIITAQDITEQKMAQHNQSDFIAHVAHELRTPLTTIKSYVEMLMDDEVSDRDTKIDFFNTITDETNRLSRLISNLLNIAKIEMGSLTIQKDLIKSREFLEDIVKSIESQAMSKHIKLDSIVPDKLTPLVMEKDLLRVSILNILGNAIKYTPEGGSVTFKVEEDDSHMTIDIFDTGYGISEEELPSIFDKFFRSSDEKIKEHTGNGLGLALSREIIRLHDGKIEVSSNLGQGTHFALKLPKEDSPRIGDYNKRLSPLLDKQ